MSRLILVLVIGLPLAICSTLALAMGPGGAGAGAGGTAGAGAGGGGGSGHGAGTTGHSGMKPSSGKVNSGGNNYSLPPNLRANAPATPSDLLEKRMKYPRS